MTQITVRNLNDELVERLRTRANRNGRSLESEIRMILSQAAKPSLDEMRERLAQMRKDDFGDRILSDSSELIREERDRR